MEEQPYAIVRGDNDEKVRIALYDLKKYAELDFVNEPKGIAPGYADRLLEEVMGVELRNPCVAASIVQLDAGASAAIAQLRTIHPPAHVLIVSDRHYAYDELVNFYH